MKRRRKQQKINRGASSGLVISLLFHGAAFFIAGLFVVFTVVNRAEPEFEPPPPIERPKMKLKKPKVKIRKSSNPRPSSRIMAKVKTKQMPEIQLPDLVGAGDGLLGGTGLGEMIMDIPDVLANTMFGGEVSSGNDFVGIYYDFNRTRSGNNRAMEPRDYARVLLDFVLDEWDASRFDKYYRSESKRYATCFMVPTIPSDLGPEAFGEMGAKGYCWAVHYRGKLVCNRDITFRFWGFGDDVLMVRVDGELVLAASWPGWPLQEGCGWTSSSGEAGVYYLGNNKAQVGDWITLEPGVPLDMEVLIGEAPGGRFSSMLLVQEKGVDYERNVQGGPILPMFTTEKPTHAITDAIYEYLIEGEAMLTNGPVFNDM